jgi:hypothetical protein
MNQPSKPKPQVIDLSGKNDPEAFTLALADTYKGDKIIYHRGLFAGGRYKADAAAAQEAGLVALVQERIDKSGDRRFVYIAQRTGKRFK